MKTSWLTRENRDSCILFYGGWGMDLNPFQKIPVHAHDLLMVYDYHRPEKFEIAALAGSYAQLHLVAWSMGVWASAFSLSGQEGYLASATAVNGTLSPIDDRCGIEQRAFAGMISNFTADTLREFYGNMFDDDGELDLFLRNRPNRSDSDILHELVRFRKYYDEQGPAGNIFRRMVVSSRDRIFTARNQVRSWGRENCTIIRAPHFPFYGWPSWDALVKNVTRNA